MLDWLSVVAFVIAIASWLFPDLQIAYKGLITGVFLVILMALSVLPRVRTASVPRPPEQETMTTALYREYSRAFPKRLQRAYPKHTIKFNITFSENQEKRMPIAELYDILASEKRVILQGAAGSGKSAVLGAISNLLLEKNIVPIVLNLKNWGPKESEQLRTQVEGSFDQRLDVLFHASIAELNLQMFANFPKDVMRVLLVDALNEVYGEENVVRIIDLLNEFARVNAPKAIVLLTDRLRGRTALYDWTVAVLDELDESEVRKQIENKFGPREYATLSSTDRDMLKTPYFLNFALTSGSANLKSKAKAIESFFRDQLSFKTEALDGLAKAGYEMYREFQCPSFEAKAFQQIVGQEIWDCLVQAGAIRQAVKSEWQFDHQLKHDFLASRYLAQSELRWTSGFFDAVTFESNSFDPLSLVLEQLSSTTQGDRFLKYVYDWNWNAAVTCVATAGRDPVRHLTSELEAAVLALVSEKLFDSIERTRERTVNVLQAFPDNSMARKLNLAKSLADVIAIIETVESTEEWFLDWKHLFARCKEPPLTEQDIQIIMSEDSVLGWTASNVIKRFNLDETDGRQLRSCYNSVETVKEPPKGPARWRIVHSLGASVNDGASVALLFHALDEDVYPWVRYGAARSLVEIAARTEDEDRRRYIITGLKSRVPSLRGNVLEEVGRAVFYRGAPNSWHDLVAPLLKGIWAAQKMPNDKDKWNRTVNEFESYWRDNCEASA